MSIFSHSVLFNSVHFLSVSLTEYISVNIDLEQKYAIWGTTFDLGDMRYLIFL